MKTYKIGVVWQMYGSVEVEANSLTEAIHIVHSRDVPLPENGEYIEGSFGTIFTKPLTITHPIVDNELIREFIDAGLYRRGKDNMWTIKRVN